MTTLLAGIIEDALRGHGALTYLDRATSEICPRCECRRVRALLEPVAAWTKGEGELPEHVKRWGELAKASYCAGPDDYNKAAAEELTDTFECRLDDYDAINACNVEAVFEAALGIERSAPYHIVLDLEAFKRSRGVRS